MNKYEKLIEYIISEQEDLARELFHEIVVEKSRHIYENLIDSVEEEVYQGDKVERLAAEVTADESVHEADDEMSMPDMGDEEGMDDMGDMNDMGDEEGMDDMGDEEGMDDMGDEEGMDGEEMDQSEEMEDLEDRVVDLESALDELKAEFDKIMSSDDKGMEDEDMVREYVEKVAHPSNTSEGHEVGHGGSVPVQKKSPALQKANNMGGKRFDLGGSGEAAPDGQRPKEANNYGTKGRKDVPHAGNFENVPGAKTKGYVNKAGAKKGEDGGVNKHSIESGN